MPARSRSLAATTALFLGLGGALVVASPAAAASFDVTTIADSGGGSLREAIFLANGSPGPDAITFALPPASVITLASTLPPITEGLTITGPGEAELTIVSAPLANELVFSSIGDPVASPLVEITDLTIVPDATEASSACGILASDTALTLSRVTVSGFGCVGVSTVGGSLTATDVTIEDCGSGIAFAGLDPDDALALLRVDVYNSANSGINANLDGSVASLTDVFVSGAGGVGVALIANNSSRVTVERTEVEGAFLGLGVSTGNGSVTTVTDSGSSQNGQGVFASAGLGSSVTLTRLAVADNTSTGLTLIASTGSTLDVVASRVTGSLNDSGISIPTLEDGSSITISGSEITGNTVQPGGADDGGGIAVLSLATDSTLTISDSIISGNSAGDFGGGLYLRQGTGATSTAKLVIERTTIDGNTAAGYGAGIAINEPDAETNGLPTVLIDSSTISNNVTPAGGGGIHIRRQSSGDAAIVEIRNSTIVDNEAQAGGAVLAFSANYGTQLDPFSPYIPGPLLLTTVINQSTITGNSAHTSGGVATSSGDQSIEISNSIIAGSISDIGDPAVNDLEVFSELPWSVRYSLVQTPQVGPVVPTTVGIVTGVDPALGALADNGGTTLTRLLTPASPAYNAGDPGFVGTGLVDQRGQARVSQRLDMGAVEWQVAIAPTGGALAATGSTVPEPEAPLIALLLVLSGLAMVAFSRLQLARSLG